MESGKDALGGHTKFGYASTKRTGSEPENGKERTGKWSTKRKPKGYQDLNKLQAIIKAVEVVSIDITPPCKSKDLPLIFLFEILNQCKTLDGFNKEEYAFYGKIPLTCMFVSVTMIGKSLINFMRFQFYWS